MPPPLSKAKSLRSAVRPSVRIATRARDEIVIASALVLDEALTNAEKAMYLVLAAFANDAGEARVQLQTLAAHYGCSTRFVRKLLAALRQKQRIRQERRHRHVYFRLLR